MKAESPQLNSIALDRHRRMIRVLAFAFVVLLPATTFGQRSQPSAAHSVRGVGRQIASDVAIVSDTSHKPSVWVYVGAGALIGGLAAGAGFAWLDMW